MGLRALAHPAPLLWHGQLDVIRIRVRIDISSYDGGHHFTEQRVIERLFVARLDGHIVKLAGGLGIRDNLDKILRPAERLKRDLRLHTQTAGLGVDTANQTHPALHKLVLGFGA